jgi:hypothetical protein
MNPPEGGHAAPAAPPDLGARLRGLPGWMVVGGLTAALLVFAIVGIALSGAASPTSGGTGPSPGGAASQAGSASQTPVPGGQLVEVANVAVTAPPGWTSTTEEPTLISLQNVDQLVQVFISAFDAGGQSLEDVVATLRAGTVAPARICRDEAFTMPGTSAPGHRLHRCSPSQAGNDTVEVMLIAVAGRYALGAQVLGGGPISIDEQLAIIERDILPTIRWKVGDTATGPTPSPTPSPGPIDSSFCAPVAAGTWTPQTLLGKSFEVAAVPIPNVQVNVFEAGRIRLVNVLGDQGGYLALDQADAVAIASFTQYDAASLRQLVVMHEGRFYVFEGRAHETSTEPDLYDPPPCRIPESDGRLERWRGGRFLTSPDLNYSGWVYYVWTPTGQNYCGTDTIRQYYPGIPQCQ